MRNRLAKVLLFAFILVVLASAVILMLAKERGANGPYEEKNGADTIDRGTITK